MIKIYNDKRQLNITNNLRVYPNLCDRLDRHRKRSYRFLYSA